MRLRFGCLAVLILVVQLSLLCWLIKEFVLNSDAEGKQDDNINGGNVIFNEDELISVFAKSTMPTPNEHTESADSSEKNNIETTTKSSIATLLTLKPRNKYWTGHEQLAEKSGRTERKLTEFEAKGIYNYNMQVSLFLLVIVSNIICTRVQ